jgi:protein-tyrosine phosphatase
VRLPIADFGVPSGDGMTTILDTIDDALARGRNVYLHCYGGVGRTGMVVGCLLVRRGATPEAALAAIADRRRGIHGGHRTSPETDAQRRFVEGWRP